MKLSIVELTTLIDSIDPTRYRPLPLKVAKILKRLRKNRRKKSEKYANKTLRS